MVVRKNTLKYHGFGDGTFFLIKKFFKKFLQKVGNLDNFLLLIKVKVFYLLSGFAERG